MKTSVQLSQNLQKIKQKASRTSLTLFLAIFVFAILLTAVIMTALALVILARTDVILDSDGNIKFGNALVLMTVISLVIGGSLAFFSSRIPLKPINNLINQLNRLAAGDFDARLEFGSALSSHPAFKEIIESFNKMAEELGNTEMLRRDFINSFSHEFKTPIASITGFARLLSKGNLTEEQKTQYLRSIEEESVRLSYMATNILNLTKVENQTILTDVTRYDLSEQIRSAVLLLESKWEEKNVDLQLDFDEFFIEANEELLKQVWINLIDNAVKFVPRCGTVALKISDTGRFLKVTVSNTGKEIPEEKQDKIFNKFYQADESRAGEGNGIGLAIVKKIIELHNGYVTVKSENGMTSLTVTLPKDQN